MLSDYIHKMVEDVKVMISSLSAVRVNYKYAGEAIEYSEILIDRQFGEFDRIENLPM